jgi:hypothetical protein
MPRFLFWCGDRDSALRRSSRGVALRPSGQSAREQVLTPADRLGAGCLGGGESDATRSREYPRTVHPSATPNARVSTSQRLPTRTCEAIVRVRSQGAVTEVIIRTMALPLKTPICRARRSPTRGTRYTLRRTPWTTSAPIRTAHTAMAFYSSIVMVHRAGFRRLPPVSSDTHHVKSPEHSEQALRVARISQPTRS